MTKLAAFLLLCSTAFAADAPTFTVSAPPQVRLGDPIIISVQVSQPQQGVVLFYRVKNQSRATAAITLHKDPTLQTVCYVWAQPARYEIEVECVVKTDAEARSTKIVPLQVYVDPELPKLPPLTPDEPKPPADPPQAPEPPTTPRPPPGTPKPPTDGDLGGLFGLGPLVKDKVLQLVPAEFRGKAWQMAEMYRTIASEIVGDKIASSTDAEKRIRELSGKILTTPQERAAWSDFNKWLGGELAKLESSDKTETFKDIVVGIAEISLGLFMSTVKEVNP